MLGLLIACLAVTLPTEPPATRTVEFEERWRTDPYSDEYLMGNVMTGTIDGMDRVRHLSSLLRFAVDSAPRALVTCARQPQAPASMQSIAAKLDAC